MKTTTLGAFIAALILASFSVSAHLYVLDYYDYYGRPYYDGYTSDYFRSSSSESVSIRESEYEHSLQNYGSWRGSRVSDHYDYGRSREFAFSRSSEYESSTRTYDGGYPVWRYSYGYTDYSYPYYDVGTYYGYDYRPYSDDYELSYTSPYYNPYRYSRVGKYASRYRPYGY
ncbi:MAG: hypothetical protein QXT19_00760 [Candidatus Woesearchaeota archaeon]